VAYYGGPNRFGVMLDRNDVCTEPQRDVRNSALVPLA
jgi:hypothetical protein